MLYKFDGYLLTMSGLTDTEAQKGILARFWRELGAMKKEDKSLPEPFYFTHRGKELSRGAENIAWSGCCECSSTGSACCPEGSVKLFGLQDLAPPSMTPDYT